MTPIFKSLLALLSLAFAGPALAQTAPAAPTPTATVRVPMCLQFPDSKTYVACTGVVPVDRITGNALDWSTIMGGLSSAIIGNPAPNTAQLVAGKDLNGNAQALQTDSNGVLSVRCANCSGGTTTSSGGGFSGSTDPNNGATYTEETVRRAHWTESTTPLDANATYTGLVHDDGSTGSGSPIRWNTFSCFAWANQNATLMIQGSVDNTTWLTLQTRTWTAGTSLFLTQPLFMKYWRCSVFNGGTANSGFILSSAFGVN